MKLGIDSDGDRQKGMFAPLSFVLLCSLIPTWPAQHTPILKALNITDCVPHRAYQPFGRKHGQICGLWWEGSHGDWIHLEDGWKRAGR